MELIRGKEMFEKLQKLGHYTEKNAKHIFK